MRRARVLFEGETGCGYYHLVSKTVNGERFIGSEGREILRRQIRQVADALGIEVITHVVLSNHFHILVRVPENQELANAELVRRYQVLYPRPTPAQQRWLDAFLSGNPANAELAASWREWMESLSGNLSKYMQIVKQRFAIWHNSQHKRSGPVWTDRFWSTLIEEKHEALQAHAAYIDLNCVRAGIVKDPKDYRHCGYAEAVAGNEAARRGLGSIGEGTTWDEIQANYRMLLFAVGTEAREGRASIPPERLEQVLKEGGKLPLAEVLRCRISYFTTAAVLGSREFVERHLAIYRKKHNCGSRMTPQPLPAATHWGNLVGLRRLSGPLFG
jgi:REP element-mobilizing transposase RayT